MVEVFSAFICCAAVIGITIWIVNLGKIEKRHIRFLLTTILVPVCVFILHRTCFFELVPHCKHCVIYEDGHKAMVDANDLRDACIYTYFLLQFVLIPGVIKNIQSTSKKVLFIILIIGLTILLGGPVKIISYM